MVRISHYFTPFQAHVISQAESDMSRFAMDQALLVLEREAKFKAEGPSLTALFVFQFEALSRNRLGYTRGLAAMAADPLYPDVWSDYILTLGARLGDVDFADLIFVRSEQFVAERRRHQPRLTSPSSPRFSARRRARSLAPIAAAIRCTYSPPFTASLATRGSTASAPDELEARVALLEQRIVMLENRMKFAENDIQHDVDLAQVLVKPEDTAGIPAGWGKKSGPSLE